MKVVNSNRKIESEVQYMYLQTLNKWFPFCVSKRFFIEDVLIRFITS